MLMFSLIALVIACPFVLGTNPDIQQLSPEQVERLKTWTEDDKQNIWELSGQFEGDMILTAAQRNGILGDYYRWENNVIPYELDSVFTEEEAAWIQSALDEFAESSCVTVRPKTDEDIAYVYVTGEDSGCWSYVGSYGGRQDLNLQRSSLGQGCFRTGTIVHEFLHAAGFYHQQSTHNRDDYVEIIWDNIPQSSAHNFDKYSDSDVTNFGEAYDYGSVMHYGAYAFSSNGEKTIVTKDPDAEIGQRLGMSEIDVNKLNKMYCD